MIIFIFTTRNSKIITDRAFVGCFSVGSATVIIISTIVPFIPSRDDRYSTPPSTDEAQPRFAQVLFQKIRMFRCER